MLVLAAIFILVALYLIATMVFKIPKVKSSVRFTKLFKNKKTENAFANKINAVTRSLAKFIPMTSMAEGTLRKALISASISMTPKEYMATALVFGLRFWLLCIPLLFIKPILALLPLAVGAFLVMEKKKDVFKLSEKRKYAIEKELPHFVSYVANSTRNSRNIIDIITTYKANLQTEFTRELSIVVGDMKTGNQEIALQRFETRVNSPMLSELVRGLISFMRGDDMSSYFQALNIKLAEMWKQKLHKQALAKEPKLAMKSYIITGASLATVFYILIALVVQIM